MRLGYEVILSASWNSLATKSKLFHFACPRGFAVGGKRGAFSANGNIAIKHSNT